MAANTWTADRRLYLNKAGQVVEADDPSRASLLVAEGASLPLDRAVALGLVTVEVKVSDTKLAAPPAENKLRASPRANKGQKSAKDEESEE